MWIVKGFSLSRTLYIVVLALVLLLIKPVILLLHGRWISFPNINIPVISVIWTYSGLAPAEMGTRIVSIFERVISDDHLNNIGAQSNPSR